MRGPLWIATQHHCIQFTSQPWVQSYIDTCMNQNLDHKLVHTDLESLNGTITAAACRFARKSIYFSDRLDKDDQRARSHRDGWSLALIQHITKTVLGQKGKVGPRVAIDFFHSALCIILNPLEAIELFPRLRHCLDIVCYVIFSACFLRLQHVEGDLAMNSISGHSSLREATAEAEYMRVYSSLWFFRGYVWAQCLGMLLTAANLASRHNIQFVLKDVFTVLDCFIAVFIVIGEVLLISFQDGADHGHGQRVGFVILCLTDLAIGWRYLDFLRSFEQIAPLVRVLGQMVVLCLSFMLMLSTILLAFAFAIYGLHINASSHAYPYADLSRAEGLHGPSFTNIVLVLVRALLGDFDLSETPFTISDPVFELGVRILMYVYVLFMIILMMVSHRSSISTAFPSVFRCQIPCLKATVVRRIS